jgi:hypothetical protein
MTTQVMFFALAGAGAVLAVLSGVRDKQRRNRPNLDRVGWVPWDVLQILGGILTVVGIVLAFKFG